MCQQLGLQLVDQIIKRRLDHEGSDLINGLIHWWINKLMVLFRSGGMWGLVGGSSHRAVPLKGVLYLASFCLYFCFLAAVKIATLFCPAILVLMKQANQGLKPLNP
jgi:hypothetical protein